MNKTRLQIDFIIPAFNASKTLKSCLESIKNNIASTDSKIIVVNNNSTDNTAQIALDCGVIVIECKEQGRSQARNAGAKFSKSEFIAFIDSDVILSDDWTKGFGSLLTLKTLGAFQGMIIPHPPEHFINRFLYDLKKEKTNSTFIEMEANGDVYPIIDTAACIYRKISFDHIGGFDESLNFHEDYDLSVRLVSSGYSIAASADAVAYKDANRTPFSYIIRTIKDSYYFAAYVRKYSRPKFLNHLVDSVEIEFRKGTFRFIYSFIKSFSYLVCYACFAFKREKLQNLNVKNSKVGLVLDQIKDSEGNVYRFSQQVRYYIGVNGIRFFIKKFKSELNVDDDFKSFFMQFLQNQISIKSFEIYKEYLLSKEIIVRLNTEKK